MITSIRLKNFFSFKDQTIEFHPKANILIGINGSGKSNLLRAFQVLETVVNGSRDIRQLFINEWGGYSDVCFSDKKNNDSISLEYNFNFSTTNSRNILFRYIIEFNPNAGLQNFSLSEKLDGKFLPYNDFVPIYTNEFGQVSEYHYEDEDTDDPDDIFSVLPRNGVWKRDRSRNNSDLYAAKGNISRIFVDLCAALNTYSYFDTSSKGRLRMNASPNEETRLSHEGENLIPLLNTIKVNDKENYKKIIECLQQVNTYFSDLDFFNVGGNIALFLSEDKLNRSIRTSHISSGTLQFLCLLSIIFNKKRGFAICIDEPESGLHPDMMNTIANEINKTNNTQFFIATHSEHFLNGFELENIIVFEKDEDNSSIVKRFNEKSFGEWVNEYSIKSLWQSGHLGGVRW